MARRARRRYSGYGPLSGVVAGLGGLLPGVPDPLLLLGVLAGGYYLYGKMKPGPSGPSGPSGPAQGEVQVPVATFMFKKNAAPPVVSDGTLLNSVNVAGMWYNET